MRSNFASSSPAFPVAVLMVGLILSVSPVFAAASGSTANKDEQSVGSDKGPHGCIASAGYTWSQVRQDCIRLFETGTALYNAQDPAATSVAYVVNGGDQLPLELFLRGRDKGILLYFRDGAWHDDDDQYALSNDKNDVISVRNGDGTLLFSSRKP